MRIRSLYVFYFQMIPKFGWMHHPYFGFEVRIFHKIYFVHLITVERQRKRLATWWDKEVMKGRNWTTLNTYPNG